VHFGWARTRRQISPADLTSPHTKPIMSAMRSGVPLLLLLLADCVLAARGGILTGTVRDVLTGAPLTGACVVINGLEVGSATDLFGHYLIEHVPETTGIATAFYLDNQNVTAPFSVTETCATELDFDLLSSYTTHTGSALADSGLALYKQRTVGDTLRVETLFAPMETHDSTALRRCNVARIALLARYRQRKDTWAVIAIGPYDSLTRRRLDIGPGFCYYREWRGQSAPVSEPFNWRHGLIRCYDGAPPVSYAYSVESLTPGYLAASESSHVEFVECPGRCPKGKLLLLKLVLAGGGTAFF
jgi:hypothetical protein